MGFWLLANADVSSNQRVSVLVNVAPKDSTLISKSTTNEYLALVTHESIATFVRQCNDMNVPKE